MKNADDNLELITLSQGRLISISGPAPAHPQTGQLQEHRASYTAHYCWPFPCLLTGDCYATHAPSCKHCPVPQGKELWVVQMAVSIDYGRPCKLGRGKMKRQVGRNMHEWERKNPLLRPFQKNWNWPLSSLNITLHNIKQKSHKTVALYPLCEHHISIQSP